MSVNGLLVNKPFVLNYLQMICFKPFSVLSSSRFEFETIETDRIIHVWVDSNDNNSSWVSEHNGFSKIPYQFYTFARTVE